MYYLITMLTSKVLTQHFTKKNLDTFIFSVFVKHYYTCKFLFILLKFIMADQT